MATFAGNAGLIFRAKRLVRIFRWKISLEQKADFGVDARGLFGIDKEHWDPARMLGPEVTIMLKGSNGDNAAWCGRGFLTESALAKNGALMVDFWSPSMYFVAGDDNAKETT